MLKHWLGLDDPSGPIYAFFSGSGSIVLPWLFTTLPILWVLLRRHNCHIHRCWRMGRHPVEGTTYTVCRHHHPDGHLTHSHMLTVHRRGWESD